MKKIVFIIIISLNLALYWSDVYTTKNIEYLKLDYFKIGLINLFIIVTPIVIAYALWLFKKNLFKPTFISLNIIIALLLAAALYGNFKKPNLETSVHYDYNESIPEQTRAQLAVEKFIRDNAKYPETYKPVKFGNLSGNKVYGGPEINGDSLLKDLKKGDTKLLEEISNEKNLIEPAEPSYSFRHSYEIQDTKGQKEGHIANISLDANLQVIDIFNEEDFGIVSWKTKYGK